MRLAAALWLLLLSVPAAASDKPSVAVELARFSLPRETWDQLLASMDGQMEQMSEQMLAQSGIPEADLQDAKEAMRSGMQGAMSTLMPAYEEMLDFQAGILAKHWSAAELQELLAFYRSPVGRKTIRVMPEVMKDSMGWMQARVQQRMPAMMERMKAEAAALAEKRASRKAEAEAEAEKK